MKSLLDNLFDEAAREFRGEGPSAYLPQLYEIDTEPETEPEEWPKENPYIKILCACESFSKGLQEVCVAFEKLVGNLKPILKIVGDIAEKINQYPNKRVVYLATHGKWRTRKKNIHRIFKWYERQGRTPGAKRSSRGYVRYIEENSKKWAVYYFKGE